MRLNTKQIDLLKEEILRLDESAEIYLFGSRVYDSKRGGDIDLLIISKIIDRKGLRSIRRTFYNYFGEQKMDLILDDGSMVDPFIRKIITQAEML